MLNLCLFHHLQNLHHHFSTVLIKIYWYTASCKYYGCSGLTSLTMNPATPPSLGGNVLYGCTNLSTIYVPNAGILLAYEAVAPWNNYNICIVESGADDTGIEAVEMEGETMSNVPVYDLNGRRVGTSRTLGSLSKGIYVVGGKKIIR